MSSIQRPQPTTSSHHETVQPTANIKTESTAGIPPPSDANQRLDLGSVIEEFISILGKENWTKYAQLTSHFILGKLSRKELVSNLESLFTLSQETQQDDQQQYSSGTLTGSSELRSRLIGLHNKLLLGIFVNSLRDSPLDRRNKSWGFQNGSDNLYKHAKRINKHNSQIETYKKIVMSLPLSDRNRLKRITKEAGKRGFIYCSVLQDRLATIPKVPVVSNQETLRRIKANDLKTPIEWSQDILNGFNAPLATDSYSLPDVDTLYLRMSGIAREHGLVGAVDAKSVELLSKALDYYLKRIVELGIDSVRYRTKKYSDFYDLDEDGIYRPVTDTGDDNIAVSIPNANQDTDFWSKSDNLMLGGKTGEKPGGATEDRTEDDYDEVDEYNYEEGGNANTEVENEDITDNTMTNRAHSDKDNEVVTQDASLGHGSQDQMTNSNDADHDNLKRRISLTNEDMFKAFTISPNLIKATSGAYYSLIDTGLLNDDEIVIKESPIDDLPEFAKEKPLFQRVDDRNVGTREELNWLIKDLLTKKV